MDFQALQCELRRMNAQFERCMRPRPKRRRRGAGPNHPYPMPELRRSRLPRRKIGKRPAMAAAGHRSRASMSCRRSTPVPLASQGTLVLPLTSPALSSGREVCVDAHRRQIGTGDGATTLQRGVCKQVATRSAKADRRAVCRAQHQKDNGLQRNHGWGGHWQDGHWRFSLECC